jgi:hypothetical protein
MHGAKVKIKNGKIITSRRNTGADTAIHFACWVTKATNTQSEYVIFLSHYNSCFTNAPQYYITVTLSVLFKFVCSAINKVNTKYDKNIHCHI